MTPDLWDRLKTILGMSAHRHSSTSSGRPGPDFDVDSTEQFECAPQSDELPANSLYQGELIADRYRITSVIGRGGMGEVYEAFDESLRESIALKTLRGDMEIDDSMIRRFQKEIQLARKVTHPNVCRLFETGVHRRAGLPPLPFFTMELLEGETISARIRRAGRFSRRDAFPIAVQIAEGLQAAHEIGVVHADFKSGNVILVPRPGGDRAVITDFGLARLDPRSRPADETRTMSTAGRIAGTMAYMSPEQMTGATLTPSSDIYSFGIVLFEMATGKRPFDDRHLIHAAMQRAGEKGITARSLVRGLDPWWDAAIVRCLHRDPARRFASARDLAEWFRAEPWRIPRPHWTRRRWVATGVGAAMSLSAGGTLWIRSRRPYQPPPAAFEWFQNGVAALHSMTYEAARRAFEQAVAADPGYALAHASLARAYEELDYGDLAKESMLRAMTLGQDSRLSGPDRLKLRALEFMVSRDYDRALPLFQQIEANAAPRDKPAAELELGWIAQQRDDTEGAASAYQRALALDPRYAAAKLRLGFILGRKRQVAAALNSYGQAEALYSAASNYEGVAESLYQQTLLLNRSNRSAEAMASTERGLALARASGNTYQEIRFQLAQSEVVQHLGDPARAAALAREGVDAAVSHRMDNIATIGLINWGNAYLANEDLVSAEPIFRKALDLAGRARVRRNEARARMSLASLCEQDHRPGEARRFIETTLPFYRQAGFRREFVQATMLLGSVRAQLAEFDQGVAVLREALTAALQLQDSQTEETIRERLGFTLLDQGAWPQALEELERAAAIAGPKGAHPRLGCADLYRRLGRRQECQRSLSEAATQVERTTNRRLLADLRILRARIAYQDAHIHEAISLARLEPSEPRARLIEACALLRSGRAAAHQIQATDVIAGLARTGLPAEVSSARLTVAEALMAAASPARDLALKLAQEVVTFSEPRNIWESAWRAHAVAAWASNEPAATEAHKAAARAALARLRESWPPGTLDAYLQRPDIRRLENFVRI